MGSIYLWIPVAIAVLSLVAVFKKEEAQKLNDAASSIFSLVLSSIWLPVWAFIQWLVGAIIGALSLDTLDSQFLLVFRWLFAAVTLFYVALEIYVSARQSLIRARRRIEEEAKR